MFIAFRQKSSTIPKEPNVVISRNRIERGRTYKCLGLGLDESLTWEYHISSIICKVSEVSGYFQGQVLIYNSLRWLPTISKDVKLLRTHSPVTKFILNTPKTGQCEYFQEKHEGHCCTYNEK